jgi:hypothetical protein
MIGSVTVQCPECAGEAEKRANATRAYLGVEITYVFCRACFPAGRVFL